MLDAYKIPQYINFFNGEEYNSPRMLKTSEKNRGHNLNVHRLWRLQNNQDYNFSQIMNKLLFC